MQPIKKVRLHAEVVKAIEEYIRENNIIKGERLPSERELTEKLEIGRSSIREGLRILEAMEIIEVKVGKGIFVKNYSPYAIKTNIEITAEKESLLQMMEVRRVLELEAIRLAIKRASEEDILKVEEKYMLLKQKEDKCLDASFEDRAFHQTIYKASKNEILAKMLDSVDGVFYKIWDEPFGQNFIFKSAFEFHGHILTSLKLRDAEKAEKAVNALMDSMEKQIISISIDNLNKK